jgi:hypothetical protein
LLLIMEWILGSDVDKKKYINLRENFLKDWGWDGSVILKWRIIRKDIMRSNELNWLGIISSDGLWYYWYLTFWVHYKADRWLHKLGEFLRFRDYSIIVAQ